MKLLKVSDKAFKKYKSTVRGNENITYEQAQKKLTRNAVLVKETAPERIKRKWFNVTYSYGNLDIICRFGTVIDIVNHKGVFDSNWKFPRHSYQHLNKVMGIPDDKFKKNSFKR